MHGHVTMDAAGRIVLPKPVRAALGLRANDLLDLNVAAGQIALALRRDSGRLRKRDGIWVLPADAADRHRTKLDDYNRLQTEIRDERLQTVGTGRW